MKLREFWQKYAWTLTIIGLVLVAVFLSVGIGRAAGLSLDSFF